MIIRLAERDDIPAIIDLLKMRIAWMDEMELYQWNKTDYLGVYPPTYFEGKVDQQVVFVACQGSRVVGIIALFPEDPRWPDSKPARYVHHLATDPSYPGLGVTMLEFAEDFVLNEGGIALRLDCQTVNPALNRYYEKLGYLHVGTCVDGAYEGNLMEKPLRPKEKP